MRFLLERHYGAWRIAKSEGTGTDDLKRICGAMISFPSLRATIEHLYPDAEIEEIR